MSSNGNKPRVHAEVIKAWADGASIEYFSKNLGNWEELGDYGPWGWYPDVRYRVKKGSQARAATPQPAPEAAKGVRNDDAADRLLREVFALCEATEDAPEIEPKNEHQAGFDRGRRFEAKHIRRGIGTWFQDTFCGRSFMGEPVPATPPAPEAQQGEPFGYLRQSSSAKNPPHGWAFHFAGKPGDVAVYTNPEPQQPAQAVPLSLDAAADLVEEASLDWQKGWAGDPAEVNRYLQLVRLTERAHGIGVKLAGGVETRS